VRWCRRAHKLKKITKKYTTNFLETRRHKTKDKIKKTDKEIDEKVYELYGLTEEERKVVEGKKIVIIKQHCYKKLWIT